MLICSHLLLLFLLVEEDTQDTAQPLTDVVQRVTPCYKSNMLPVHESSSVSFIIDCDDRIRSNNSVNSVNKSRSVVRFKATFNASYVIDGIAFK